MDAAQGDGGAAHCHGQRVRSAEYTAKRNGHIRAGIDFDVEQIQLSLARRPPHLSIVQAA